MMRKDMTVVPIYGRLMTLDLNTKKVVCEEHFDTTGIHGLYIENGEVSLIKSRYHHIWWKGKNIESDKFKKAFLRGMAGDANELALSGSKVTADRLLRSYADPKIFIVNDEGVRGFNLDGHGGVQDIRRIDGVDYGHNNPHKFPLPS